ncbi:MAG: hypothetical protein HPY68_04565 [Candidatus Atribacteria bacterium]|nr:hypothetical protein [Candidatus Atribacteria bacterium]
MAISRYDMGVAVKPEVVAAIAAVLSEILKEEKEAPKEIRPYVVRKNRGWKEIALQEGSLVVHFLRR